MRWIAVGVLFVMLVLLAAALSYGARQLRGSQLEQSYEQRRHTHAHAVRNAADLP